jgi:hypothetical protein
MSYIQCGTHSGTSGLSFVILNTVQGVPVLATKKLVVTSVRSKQMKRVSSFFSVPCNLRQQ